MSISVWPGLGASMRASSSVASLRREWNSSIGARSSIVSLPMSFPASFSSGMMMSVLILLICDVPPNAMNTGQLILAILARVNFCSSGV